jgi:Phage integrase family
VIAGPRVEPAVLAQSSSRCRGLKVALQPRGLDADRYYKWWSAPRLACSPWGRNMQREGDIALRVRGKSNKERVVGLPSQAVEAIDAYLATRPGAKPEEPMFLISGGCRITARVITKAVARAGRRLKTHLHLHLFRHTYATTSTERPTASSSLCAEESAWPV